MFSNNQKISMRQTFRLFTFDLVGISSLIIPTYLARIAGCDGLFCILIGGAAGILYLALLGAAGHGMNTDIGTYMKTYLPAWLRSGILIWLGIHCILIAGFCTYVFATLVQQSLIKKENYMLIVLVILALSAYSVSGGMESRARSYEVLFWFVFLPLILMLLAGVREMEPVYLTPMAQTSLWQIAKGSYVVFIFLELVFWMLFFPRYVHPDKAKKGLIGTVCGAVLFTIVLLFAMYVILLGNFGDKALAQMDFPAVTLMSTVPIAGDFIKRLDAVMLGIWFFTLLALLNLHIFYGVEMCRSLVEIKGQKKYIAFILALVLGVTLLFAYQTESTRNWFFGYICYAGAPFLAVMPFAVVLIGRWRKT